VAAYTAAFRTHFFFIRRELEGVKKSEFDMLAKIDKAFCSEKQLFK
jgi:hypothetical protein